MATNTVVVEKDLKITLTEKFIDSDGNDASIIFVDTSLQSDHLCNVTFDEVKVIYAAYEKKATPTILESLGLLSQAGNFALELNGFRKNAEYVKSHDFYVVVKLKLETDKKADSFSLLCTLSDKLSSHFKTFFLETFKEKLKVKCCEINSKEQFLRFFFRKIHKPWSIYEENLLQKAFTEDSFTDCLTVDPKKLTLEFPSITKRQQLVLSVKLSFFDGPAFLRIEKSFAKIRKRLENWSIVLQTDIRKRLMLNIQQRIKSIDLSDREQAEPVDPMDRLTVLERPDMFLFGKKIQRVIALIVVDVQNDFISGNLALRNAPAKEEGEEVVPIINKILEDNTFDLVVFTQDWHPPDHCSFITNIGKYKIHPCSKVTVDSAKVFDRVVYDGDPVIVQEMWPVHCVQGSHGAKFHAGVNVPENCIILQKGQNPEIDAYSAFWDNARRKQSELKSILRERRVTTVVIAGIATDYCVGATAVHAAEFGFDTYVAIDACRGIDKKEIKIRLQQMENRGVKIIPSYDIPQRDSPWLSLPPPSPGLRGFTEDTINLRDLLENFYISKRLEEELDRCSHEKAGWFKLGCALTTFVGIDRNYLTRLKNRELAGGADPAEELFTRMKTSHPSYTVQEFYSIMKHCKRRDICKYLDELPHLPELFSKLSIEHTEHLSSCLNERHIPGWDVLAAELHYTTSEIDLIRGISKQSGYMYSPCKNLLLKLVQVSPELKVRALMDCLRRIERYDVVKFLADSMNELNNQRTLSKSFRGKTF